MLVTNSQLKVSDEAFKQEKFSLMGRIVRAFSNGFNKIVEAEMSQGQNKLGAVPFAGSIQQSINGGISKEKSA